jgi:perosamine synthetase
MKVPVSAPDLGRAEARTVSTALREGWVSSRGRFITEFEDGFSHFSGGRFGVATTSGTTALHLALATLGIGPGDEVILPDSTMVACLDAVLYTGARPVLVDVDPTTWTLDPDRVEDAITPRTRAIMPVHLYGHPARMDPLLALARRHDLRVVEDAAEAHGALYRGKPVGALGDVGCFSFYSNKVITTGEGGMLVTRRSRIADRARRLRDLAFATSARDYRHSELAFNYRMTNLQAAIGVAQLRRIEGFIQHHRSCARIYADRLRDVEGVELPSEAPWARSVYWMYTVLVRKGDLARRRLMGRLRRAGVETRVAFWPLHRQRFARPEYRGKRRFPVADRIGDAGLSLPSGNGISERMVEHVCDLVTKWAGQ